MTDLAALLRWYPASWRDRYGDELVALMEDDLDGRRPTLGYRASMAMSGMGQRARSAGLAGTGAAPEVRVRAGALVVLVSWAALVLGGAAFAKASEHYSYAVQARDHRTAVVAFDVVIGGGRHRRPSLVLSGAVVALPAAVRFLRGGGWSSVRRPMATAMALTSVLILATAGVAQWAHHLTFHQRNGGDVPYGIAVLGWALLVAATLGTWTWAGVRTARRIDLGAAALRIEAYLALAVAAVVATRLGGRRRVVGGHGRGRRMVPGRDPTRNPSVAGDRPTGDHRGVAGGRHGGRPLRGDPGGPVDARRLTPSGLRSAAGRSQQGVGSNEGALDAADVDGVDPAEVELAGRVVVATGAVVVVVVGGVRVNGLP